MPGPLSAHEKPQQGAGLSAPFSLPITQGFCGFTAPAGWGTDAWISQRAARGVWRQASPQQSDLPCSLLFQVSSISTGQSRSVVSSIVHCFDSSCCKHNHPVITLAPISCHSWTALTGAEAREADTYRPHAPSLHETAVVSSSAALDIQLIPLRADESPGTSHLPHFLPLP